MCTQVWVHLCARRHTRVMVEVYDGGGSRSEERSCWSCCLASRQKSLLRKCGEQGLKRRGESLEDTRTARTLTVLGRILTFLLVSLRSGGVV